ncbi:hypothetical protein HYX17_04535 [Candidatus Woesearchaeota archaeon]|nr:hypothetical protein [Candidatus Woesearchaeota archaeon]
MALDDNFKYELIKPLSYKEQIPIDESLVGFKGLDGKEYPTLDAMVRANDKYIQKKSERLRQEIEKWEVQK